MNMNLLKGLYGREITVNYKENTAYLDKWSMKRPRVELDRNCIERLIKLDILEEGSGCFETHESHFILNAKNLIKNKDILHTLELDPLLSALRDIRIDKLLKLD